MLRGKDAANRGTAPRIKAHIEWLVLALLVISVGINYIDRSNLSIAGVELAKELKLQPYQLGILYSAFFWTYSTCQIFAGWLIDRYSVVWVFAFGYLLWSGATIATGLLTGFASLFLIRLLLGAGESVAYPAYSKILAVSFPEKLRGTANGLIDVGCKLGPALGLLIGGTILAHFGWRALFISVGVASLLWLLPWCLVAPGLPQNTRLSGKHNSPGYFEILRKRQAWGTILALFTANYVWYFLLTWLPSYLQMERHFTTEAMALFGSVPFFTVATGALFAGSASDWFIRGGASPNRVRKIFVSGGLIVCALFLMPAAIAPNPATALVLLSVATFFYGFFSGNHWGITQTLAGPEAAAKWTAVQNCMGNLAGIAAPAITGFIVQRTHSFYFAFVVVCFSLLISALSYAVFIGRIERVSWRSGVTVTKQYSS